MKEPVTMPKSGPDDTQPKSADFTETVMKDRVVRRVEDLDEATIKAIAAAEVPGKYAHLDEEPKQR
jgi:hypothetical protein